MKPATTFESVQTQAVPTFLTSPSGRIFTTPFCLLTSAPTLKSVSSEKSSRRKRHPVGKIGPTFRTAEGAKASIGNNRVKPVEMWISPDPMRQFHSPYSYSPNPLNTVDPDGRQSIPQALNWSFSYGSQQKSINFVQETLPKYSGYALIGTEIALTGASVVNPALLIPARALGGLNDALTVAETGVKLQRGGFNVDEGGISSRDFSLNFLGILIPGSLGQLSKTPGVNAQSVERAVNYVDAKTTIAIEATKILAPQD